MHVTLLNPLTKGLICHKPKFNKLIIQLKLSWPKWHSFHNSRVVFCKGPQNPFSGFFFFFLNNLLIVLTLDMLVVLNSHVGDKNGVIDLLGDHAQDIGGEKLDF